MEAVVAVENVSWTSSDTCNDKMHASFISFSSELELILACRLFGQVPNRFKITYLSICNNKAKAAEILSTGYFFNPVPSMQLRLTPEQDTQRP